MNQSALANGGVAFRLKPLGLAIQASIASIALATFSVAHAEDASTTTGENSEEVVQLSAIEVTAKGENNSESDPAEEYTGKKTRASSGLPLSVKETPQSVTVITEKRIEDQNLTTVDDVLAQATGISVKEYDSARQFYFARGFEITNFLIDGVPTPFRPGWGTGENTASTSQYEQVEIIKGPTGLMTGIGDPSAAINLVRKRADSEEFEGSATVGGGSRDGVQASLDVASALNEGKTIRGRAVVSHEQQDSFREIGDSENSLVYLTTEADLSVDTLLTLGASYQRIENNAPTWGGLPIWYDDGTRADWSRSKTTAADWAYWDNSHKTAFVELSHYLNNNWQINARATYGESDSDSRLLYVYGNPNKDTGEGLFAWTGGNFNTDSKYHMVDLFASGQYGLFGRNHDATFGVSRAEREFVAHSHNATSVAPIGNFNEWDGRNYPEHVWGPEFLYEDRTDTQLALYGSTRLNVTDKLKTIIGARITDLEVERAEAEFNDEQTIEHDIVSPYVGLLYDINETYTAYASYTDIFKPQDELDASGDSLDPIEGASYELGVKAGFMNDRLIASAAVFRIEQDNLAQADGTNTVEGSADQAYREAEGATSKGVELELVGAIREDWDVQVGATYYEAEDADGEDVNTVQPRKLLKAFTSYRLPGALRQLTIGGGVNWESSVYADTTNPITGNPEEVEQDSLTLVHLMAKYQVTDDFRVQLNVDNVTDEKYFTNVGQFGQVAFGEPRTVSLLAKYDF